MFCNELSDKTSFDCEYRRSDECIGKTCALAYSVHEVFD
jgi:hypothetical protein